MIPFRLALIYATLFGMYGFFGPYWPKWLEAKGLDGRELGLATGLLIFGKVVASPLFCQLSDRAGRRKPFVAALSATAFLVFWLFCVVDSFWAIA